MVAVLNHWQRYAPARLGWLVLPWLGVALWLGSNASSLASDDALWLSLCAAPFIIRVQRGHTGAWRFAPWALGCAALALVSGINVFYYFFSCFALLLLLEFTFGRVSWPTVAYLLWLSPLFRFLLRSSSTELRLWLSEMAAKALALVYGPQVQAQGNLIMLGTEPFSVDQACAGLQMIHFSVLVALMVLAWIERKRQRSLGPLTVLLGLVAGLGCCLLANLQRIVLLVMFGLGENGVMHQAMGVLALLCLVGVPALLIYRWVPAGKPLAPTPMKRTQQRTQQIQRLWLPLLVLASMVTLHFIKPGIGQRERERVDTHYDGQVLVYKKHIPYFFSVDHNPSACWQGSGYTLQSVREAFIQGKPVKLGTLVKDEEVLHTAWWYQVGPHSTASSLQWRWLVLKAKSPCTLTNLTMDTEEALLNALPQHLP